MLYLEKIKQENTTLNANVTRIQYNTVNYNTIFVYFKLSECSNQRTVRAKRNG